MSLLASISNDTVAIDTETTGEDLRDGSGYAMGMSIAYRDGTGITSFYIPFRHGTPSDFVYTNFKGIIQKILDTRTIVFHNAKFDLVSLKTLGFETDHVKFYDTMLIAHLVDENKPYSGKGLDSLAKYYLKDTGKEKSKQFNVIQEKLGWSSIWPELMAEYAAKDAELTLRLFEFLWPKYQAQMPDSVWEHKAKFTRLIMNMELRGVKVDVPLCKEMSVVGKHRMTEIIDYFDGRNPSSPKDLYSLLCGDLRLPEIKSPKTGRRTFDKNAMEQYEMILEHVKNPAAQKILQYRGWQKTVSSNYDSYLELLGKDGRLHPNYKLHGTRTGRLSCEKPNLQQIPRESTKEWNGKLKQAFIAKDDFELWEFDYSQLELRLGTAYANEPHLKEVFLEGRDIFTEMANRLGMPRQDTKMMVYSIQYGAGANRVSQALGISLVEARKRIDNYYENYPMFRAVSQKAARLAKQNMWVPLWSGRRRHFEYPDDNYKAFNSVIQGGAADIVEHVMLELDKKVSSSDCRMLLTVHDSVVFEIEKSVVEEASIKIKEVMSDVTTATGKNFDVKFAVDGKEWGKHES